MMLWGATNTILGWVGEPAAAVLTSISRQGGERNEVTPNRYTYSIGYTFTLPGGKRVDGFTTRVGGPVFIKADGKSTIPVRYFKTAPFINALEEDTGPSLKQVLITLTGAFLIIVMNQEKGKGNKSGFTIRRGW
jgi:hypothetical protein